MSTRKKILAIRETTALIISILQEGVSMELMDDKPDPT
jgi:hypothetical protein